MLPQFLALPDPSFPTSERRLAYYDWGDQNNPNVIVCSHGLSRNGSDFAALAHRLSPYFRVICPDMAGRGKSDWLKNKTDYNYGVYIFDTLALLNYLGLAQVSWVGTSMGGIIGMTLAAQQPQRILRMVLNDVGSVVSAEGLKRILGYVGGASVFATQYDALQYIQSIAGPFGLTTQDEWQQFFDASFHALPDGTYKLAYDPAISQPFREATMKADAIADVDLSAAWNFVTCPVLIMRGQSSDILNRDVARAMCERAAPTTLIEIPGAGHAPALLNDEQTGTIERWLLNPA